MRILDEGVLELAFPADPDEETLRGYVAEAEAFYRRTASPFVWVVDGTHVASSTSAQRRILSDLLKREEATLAARCRGMALVVPSAILRGAVQAIYWLAPPRYPHRTFANLDEARAWAREQLR